MKWNYSLLLVLFVLHSGRTVGQPESREMLEQGSWIGVSYPESPVRRPCPVFRRDFVVKGRVRSATLYITALGLYQAELNGRRIEQSYFTPGFTNYAMRLQYQRLQVGGLVQGKNELKVTVGEGWYRGVFRGVSQGKASDTANNHYGNDAGLLAVLRLEYTNGREERIISDKSWSCAPGPIHYSELYGGELFDASYQINGWQQVKLLDHSKDILVPWDHAPVKKQQRVSAVRMIHTPKGETVVDFGQNMAGWVQIHVRGRKGDTLRLEHAEVLDGDGNFYNGNLRTARATDSYVLKGEGTEILEPHFTYHGFRYVKVSGFKPRLKDLTAVALYSDLRCTGSFSCSNPLINRLQQNIEWSLQSNFVDIPTDCPQRSERLGWTADAQVFAATASYLRDTRFFYQKWLADLSGEQRTDGSLPVYIPSVAPAAAAGKGVAGWGDAATIIPWTLYQVYGDRQVLEDQYASMKAWVDFIQGQAKHDLWDAGGYGDWLAPGDSTSLPFVDQCFYAHSVHILVATARVLGKRQDDLNYSALEERVRLAFSQAFGKFDSRSTSTQTACVLALNFELVDDSARAEVAGLLARRIEENGGKLSTGFLGTPYLLSALSGSGNSDLAYRLLLQTECPSWLYPISKGATTIWERWDAIRPDGSVQPVSFNHYAYGAVGQWLYEHVAGIRAAAPGYEKVVISPEVGGNLTWAQGRFLSVHGPIVSRWKRSGNKVHMHVEIPKGGRATVFVPGKAAVEVGGGKYNFNGLL